MKALIFEVVDQNYYMADMSEVDQSGRWVIAKGKGKRFKAGIEDSDKPNELPVKWLIDGTFKECEHYLNNMHLAGQNYNSFEV